MSELKERDREVFKVLLVHWINHNGEHVAGYREWSDKMRVSRPEVAEEIDEAIASMEAAAKSLMLAKIRFQEAE
ncbi:MAG: hypothetical protein Q4C55_06215 [Eubacterium sp.]|nr:hypothetical protein [Eubacterium sp.]